MKLILTSAGLSNDSIKKAFFELVGKPAEEIKIAYIPTASNIEEGDKWWLIKDYSTLHGMGFAQLDIVDIAAVPKKVWMPRLEEADVLLFGGGNTFYLLYWIKKSGLMDELSEFLKTKVWVGISAGSMAPGMSILNDEDRATVKNVLGEDVGINGLGYTRFSLKPHYLSPLFDGRGEADVAKEAEQVKEPLYAIDDNSAIVIDGDRVEVVSEGQWKKFV
jgi:dipeptidase E